MQVSSQPFDHHVSALPKGAKEGDAPAPTTQTGRRFLMLSRWLFQCSLLGLQRNAPMTLSATRIFMVRRPLQMPWASKPVWDQITPYHAMRSRSRWLGVWARSDVALQAFPFHLKLPTVAQTHWTDQRYQFSMPPRWTSQLQLSPSASYSRQHQLAEHHLLQKGIFACLQESASGFRFLDPALFCSLFGTTEHIVLSEKIEESFHFVGTAITVPHSILALSIVLHATSSCAIDPIGLVRKVWSQRLTAYNAILFAHEGLVHLIPKNDFWKWASLRTLSEPGKDRNWILSGTCAEEHFEFRVRANQTIQQVFCEHCSAPHSMLQQICGLNSEIACQENTFRLVLGLATIGNCELRAISCTETCTTTMVPLADYLNPSRLSSRTSMIIVHMSFSLTFSGSSKHCKTALL